MNFQKWELFSGSPGILLEKILDEVIDQRLKERLTEQTLGNNESRERYQNRLGQCGICQYIHVLCTKTPR